MDGSDPIENYRAIRGELVQYGHGLAERPEVVAVSKAELPGADQVREQLAATIGREVLLFSAVTGQGLDTLLRTSYSLLKSRDAVLVHREQEFQPFAVSELKRGFLPKSHGVVP
jgi:GTP-binding protein